MSDASFNSFESGLEKIRSLEIQGAENIARFSLKLIRSLVLKYKDKNDLYSLLTTAKIKLFKTRPTEPCMRNSLNYVFLGLEASTISIQPKKIIERIDSTLEFLDKSEKYISEIGARKIQNGMIIYTHCHSSTVMSILKKAKDQKKEFVVHNTETRPRFQGRKTAKELADYGIKVNHFIDSAARFALKKADMMLIGADALIESRIFNKIGSEMFCEIAEKYDIPVFVCSTSWKYDPMARSGYEEVIEERSPDEVWEKPPSNVNIINPAFEKINTTLITAVISELGILSPDIFFNEIREKYDWMR
ncbi:MAG: translation initiation factor eIF-2B [Candidatus Woesearchaeota archaeon]